MCTVNKIKYTNVAEMRPGLVQVDGGTLSEGFLGEADTSEAGQDVEGTATGPAQVSLRVFS
jgi:hypothetical protein